MAIRVVVSRELSNWRTVMFLTLDCGHTVAFPASITARDSATAWCYECEKTAATAVAGSVR